MASVDEIMNQFEHVCDQEIRAVAEQLVIETREIVGVPAPFNITMPSLGNTGIWATSKATPGAPPRRLTGRLQASIGMAKVGRTSYRIGNLQGVSYGTVQELMLGHRFLTVAQEQFHFDRRQQMKAGMAQGRFGSDF